MQHSPNRRETLAAPDRRATLAAPDRRETMAAPDRRETLEGGDGEIDWGVGLPQEACCVEEAPDGPACGGALEVLSTEPAQAYMDQSSLSPCQGGEVE